VVGLQEERHEEPLDPVDVAGDLLVAAVGVGPDGGQLQPVEGALAGQRLTPIAGALPGGARGIELADDGGQQGITAEVVVVVEVFVAQGQGVDPLGHEVRQRVLDEVGLAVVGEAGGELADNGGEVLGRSEQQRAAVGGEVAAVEIGDPFAAAEHGTVEAGGGTLCVHRAVLVPCQRWLCQANL